MNQNSLNKYSLTSLSSEEHLIINGGKFWDDLKKASVYVNLGAAFFMKMNEGLWHACTDGLSGGAVQALK